MDAFWMRLKADGGQRQTFLLLGVDGVLFSSPIEHDARRVHLPA
jgi:hypothetical protein